MNTAEQCFVMTKKEKILLALLFLCRVGSSCVLRIPFCLFLVLVFFFKLTKINLEAQKVEQELRDELSKSVSKAVSDADRRQIMDLEKREMELKTEVSK